MNDQVTVDTNVLLYSIDLDAPEKMHNTKKTYLQGFELVAKYGFQIFDAIIVASALEARCNILYTEDMQHGLVVEHRLQIVNPFL